MRGILSAIVITASLIFGGTAFAQTSANGTSSAGAASQSVVQIQNQSSKSLKTTGAAIAPGLASGGIETCQGSTSAAAGGMGWGVSFGSTRMDKDCNTRLNAKMVALLGSPDVGIEIMCDIPQVAAAAARRGKYCAKTQQQMVSQQNLVNNQNRLRAQNEARRATPVAARTRPARNTVVANSNNKAGCTLFGKIRCF